MRQENLTTVKGGLNRLRTKGAALKDSLYDLLNGYVTVQRTVVVRPGTALEETLPAGTIGLLSFDGTRHIFASTNVLSIPAGYTLHVLREPDGGALSKIHFAEPFLGSLYVAAEFDNGSIYHYWLEGSTPWEADTVYDANQLITPTTDNSFVYRATRLGAPFPAWVPNSPVVVGTIFEPTTYNGLYFEVVSVVGTQPRTGTTEPDFDVDVGELVTETVDTNLPTPDPTPLPRPRFDEPGDLPRRYRGFGRNVQIR